MQERVEHRPAGIAAKAGVPAQQLQRFGVLVPNHRVVSHVEGGVRRRRDGHRRPPGKLSGDTAGELQRLAHQQIRCPLPHKLREIGERGTGGAADEQPTDHPLEPGRTLQIREDKTTRGLAQKLDVARIGHQPVQANRKRPEAALLNYRSERRSRGEGDLMAGVAQSRRHRQQRLKASSSRQQREQHPHETPPRLQRDPSCHCPKLSVIRRAPIERRGVVHPWRPRERRTLKNPSRCRRSPADGLVDDVFAEIDLAPGEPS